jgi:integrase
MRGSVQKKNGRYYVVYTLPNGKQKWEKAGTTKHEAEKLLIDRVNQIHRGEWVDIKPITFAGFVELWYAQYAEGAVRRSTLASYRSYTKNHLIPFFGPMELAKITLEDCQRFVTQKRADGLSPKAIIHCVVMLKEQFKHATRWGYLRQNPAQYVEKPRVPHREMDFLTPDEVRTFLDTAKEVMPQRYPLFLVAVMTGMRRGEVLAMKWCYLDWRRRQYFIKETCYKGRFEEPKSERSRRAVNLAPTVMDVLSQVSDDQEIRRQQPGYHDHDLIFCHNDGTPLDPDTVGKREFPRVLKAAGLRQIRFHDLRHTFTSLLIAQGESPKYIQSQLGHSSITTTLDRYGHLMPEVNEAAALRLETQVFGASIRKSLENSA